MRKLIILLCSIFFALHFTACKSGRQPNVIILITDDQGYGDLAAHGNKWIETPALDQFYHESIRLTDFHVSPTCAPTRAALMTGNYANRTGVWHTVMGRSLLREDQKTMAQIFDENGYATGMFGKWHLGDNFPFRPQDRGFQTVVAHGGGGIGQVPDYWNNDYFDDHYYRNGKAELFDGYCSDIWFDEAIDFIEENKDQPFFLYLSTNAPHGPYHVPQNYIDMYKDESAIPNPNFYGMITHIDQRFADLRQKLDQLELEENTILIFMTDNGTAAGYDSEKNLGFNAGMRGKKGSEYEGGHRVPFFVRWPAGKLKEGIDLSLLTAHVDVLPTLAEMCKLKDFDPEWVDGISLVPWLYTQKNESERVIITDSQRKEWPEKWRKSATMQNNWRLINGEELYNIDQDPGQNNDVSSQFPEKTEALKAAYEVWWEDISGTFNEYARTRIGNPAENPVVLVSHDWHEVEKPQSGPGENNPPWHQVSVRRGEISNGFWAVNFTEPGRYRFELRRYPLESGLGLNDQAEPGDQVPGGDPYPAGKSLTFEEASVEVFERRETIKIDPDQENAVLEMELPAGDTKLKTYLRNGENVRGAYYVYITKL